MKSQCCNEDVTVHGDVTKYTVCNKCLNDCDVILGESLARDAIALQRQKIIKEVLACRPDGKKNCIVSSVLFEQGEQELEQGLKFSYNKALTDWTDNINKLK